MKDAFDIYTNKICFSRIRLHLVSSEYKGPSAGGRAEKIPHAYGVLNLFGLIREKHI